jgi:HTH-type transcriptional regulator/antitoxin HigA
MSTATLSERKYGAVLGRFLPAVIRTEAEYQRMLAAASELMGRDEDDLSEEEGRVLELLSILIEEYEDRVHPLPRGRPGKTLAHLLAEHRLKPSDLWGILPKSRVSEILARKRSISKDQARKLAEFFRVPVDLFL